MAKKEDRKSEENVVRDIFILNILLIASVLAGLMIIAWLLNL
jgi:hypothetical protein